MASARVFLFADMPEPARARLLTEFPGCDLQCRDLSQASVIYGLPPIEQIRQAPNLRWIQLISAGVPPELCPAARERGQTVTNLAGLYGATIAEHALALMTILARNLHNVLRNQQGRSWDRTVDQGMADLHGKTVAVLGLGSIGQGVVRLTGSYGMRVLGFRRRMRPAWGVDRIYSRSELPAMLGEAEFGVVTLPVTNHTEGLLGPAEFAALKRGAIYVNVSRGPVAQEAALLAALQSGQVRAAGLDVFAVEPLPPEHPFWTMPQVLVSPHYSGETVNTSSLPAERFMRNLHSWLGGGAMEGVVDLEWGY